MTVWTKVLSSIVILFMLSGCVGSGSPMGNKIYVQEYSKEFQKKLKAERNAMKPPCAYDIVNENCSAANRAIMDYGDQRERVRKFNQASR